ncbi:YcxB family protein [Caproiciproducens sp. CPB-2]|uniref:YcxB family protein n=1 Tax=unclassified Caproiciproducens TaxID=2643836 RepID=UPI0023DA35BA|nr:YcxB family protein [Caproiciproducens sp. CPB-2]MDF1494724.1 YcxB family protein [Caproiciproducens sp. CPB-2]
MPESPISVSCLTTKFDYADFKAAAAKAAMRKSEKIILKATGTVLILAAFLLRAFVYGNFYQNFIYAAMAAVGVIIGCFYDTIVLYAVRRHALSYFTANSEKFIAQTTEFSEETITFQTERYTAAIPYEMLYKAYEDARVFIIYTGINEMRFIPKRAMNESECARIHNILETKLQEKYQQEGAR